ncbi:MAG: hypothetical protein K0V04_25945 [Deltaproteobacteria bacterium]|nr:hypothetical protein [Deltaproteobacteria bacterium]
MSTSPAQSLWGSLCTELDDWPADDLAPMIPVIDAVLQSRPRAHPLRDYERRAVPYSVPNRPAPMRWLDRLASGERLPQARLLRRLGLPDDVERRWTPPQWARLVSAPELDGVVWVDLRGFFEDEYAELLCMEGRLTGARAIAAPCNRGLMLEGNLDWLLHASWSQDLDLLDLSESLYSELEPLFDYPAIRIRHLMLEECWVVDEALESLFQWPPLAHMRRLNLRLNSTSDDGVARAIECATQLHADLTVIGLRASDPRCRFIEHWAELDGMDTT